MLVVLSSAALMAACGLQWNCWNNKAQGDKKRHRQMHARPAGAAAAGDMGNVPGLTDTPGRPPKSSRCQILLSLPKGNEFAALMVGPSSRAGATWNGKSTFKTEKVRSKRVRCTVKRSRYSEVPTAGGWLLLCHRELRMIKPHRGKPVSMRRKLHRLMLVGDMHGFLLSGERTHHVGSEERSAQVEQNHALHALGHAEKTPLLPAPLPGLDLLSSPQQLVQPLGRMRVLRHGTMHVACALAALL